MIWYAMIMAADYMNNHLLKKEKKKFNFCVFAYILKKFQRHNCQTLYLNPY